MSSEPNEATGDGPQHEAGADCHQVEDRLVLDPEGVGQVDESVNGHDQGQVPSGQGRAQPDRGGQEHDGEGQGQPDRHHPAGDRAQPLGRVVPVGGRVDGVVEEVGARRGHAEDAEGGHAVPEHGPVQEVARGARGHEHQQVLDPLAGSAQPDETAGERRW
jgi:hypothetical protein